jgi:hypothetical protein
VTSDQPAESGSSVRWRRVYVAVVIYTVIMVILLWSFWRYFAS